MKRSLRVLWLVKGLGAGGAERLLVSAARVGDHERFDYEAAYVVPEKDTLVPELERCGVPSHCLSSSRTPWPLALRRLLAHGQYDIVHVHSPLIAGVARVVALTLPRGSRPVVVSTEHNTWDSYLVPTRLLNALLYATDKKRWAVSPKVRDSIWTWLRGDVEVLVYGIVLTDAEPGDQGGTLREELGIAPDEVVAVTVANFRREKGYPDLLRAAKVATDKEPRLRLVIVGQGVLEPQIRALRAELDLEDRCLMLGYRDDVMRVLEMSDFFVLASHFEGFPIALMEAMAAGLPVVATKVGGAADAVTEGREGFLVPPGQPDLLAQAIARLADDDTGRSRMGSAARARGRQFDVTHAIRTIEATYETLALGTGQADS